MSLYRLARPALFGFDAETAHGIGLRALAAGLVPCRAKSDPILKVERLGLAFPNPLGMAAGFDKNGEAPDALLALGFGFTEAGTVTPRPQDGNPRPRMFRAPDDGAVINRLGFNNQGHAAMHARLVARRAKGGIVGVNVGANKDQTDRPADYVAGIEVFADVASYFTVNISSPNTPGLRDLQARSALADLLARCTAARDAAAARHGRRVPILLKIAPDVDDAGLEDIAAEVLDKRIEGVIATNTTLARDGLGDRRFAAEAGGLSGRPLFRRSTVVLAKLRRLLGPEPVIVGVGGIDSGETAWAKIVAGADLLQLYTGLVFEGPGLVGRILDDLAHRLRRERLASIGAAVGRDAEAWARQAP